MINLIAGIAITFFVFLGLLVRFSPEALTGVDTSVQTLIRGNLPAILTRFFKGITFLGNTSTQIVILLVLASLLYLKHYKKEALYLISNGILAALFIVSLKYFFQRPRPSISHLVEANGYSFPSGHSLGMMLILGSLIVISCRLLTSKKLAYGLSVILGLLILLVGISRIYLGVHYPTDVVAGFAIGFAVLTVTTSYYKR
ncbi:undecaprenyl-diphosphatase [Streptococcus saliviloxodontae]|uniref:Undecaprenyl-diphosphatase n=1 Tax=Streptococcus saliviloxodontae TaxID=1349416 RepID=A0ABS2PJM9_9STRE|nr:undecaprenyl-diphosphatase [Streptococcus saliviloxodontae]